MNRALRAVACAAALLYVAVGLLELLLADGSLAHRIVFAVVLSLFAALVVVGVGVIDTRPWVGAAIASVGALAGGLTLFWTVAAVLLAIGIVVLSILVARRTAVLGAQPA
jgi:hypothetical protein